MSDPGTGGHRMRGVQRGSNLLVADRVRETLGSIERQRQLRPVDAITADHIVTLHGRVPSTQDRAALEDAVLGIGGVHAIESFIQVQHTAAASPWAPPDRPRSAARRRLEAAAAAAGADDHPSRAVAAVLGSFCSCMPAPERSRLETRLPGDVAHLTRPPRRRGVRQRVCTVQQLLDRVRAADPSLAARTRDVTSRTLRAFATLLADDARAIGDVLPPELARLWASARRDAVVGVTRGTY